MDSRSIWFKRTIKYGPDTLYIPQRFASLIIIFFIILPLLDISDITCGSKFNPLTSYNFPLSTYSKIPPTLFCSILNL